MKITPVLGPSHAAVDMGGGITPRSIKMQVNATPTSFPLPQSQEDKKLSILENSGSEATTEATKPLSPQFAELARQRRALQVKARAIAEKERSIQEKLQGSSSIELARLKSDPLNVLLENGVTYDQLTEAVLASQEDAKVRALEQKLQALEQGIDQKFTEREQRAEQQALAEMRREANLLISTSKDFELVKETRSLPDVMRLIEQNYKQNGEVLDVREALRLVEDELFNDAQKLANIEKVKQKLMPSQIPAPSKPQPGIRTLTNKHTASVPMGRKERAILAAYGMLKN